MGPQFGCKGVGCQQAATRCHPHAEAAGRGACRSCPLGTRVPACIGASWKEGQAHGTGIFCSSCSLLLAVPREEL